MFASFAFSGLVAEQGSPAWLEREDATDELRSFGVWAYPAIAAGAMSPSPEISVRCQRLLIRTHAIEADLAAAAIFFGLDEPDYPNLFEDHAERRRLARVATALGCDWYSTYQFDPKFDPDPVQCFFFEANFWSGIDNAVSSCRRQLRTQSPAEEP